MRLCSVCEGNGVVKIPGGTSSCDHCHGFCYEPQDDRNTLRRLVAAAEGFLREHEPPGHPGLAFNELIYALLEAKKVLG